MRRTQLFPADMCNNSPLTTLLCQGHITWRLHIKNEIIEKYSIVLNASHFENYMPFHASVSVLSVETKRGLVIGQYDSA
jgi:hypothetical protein